MPSPSEELGDLTAPWPWFGGKKQVAHVIWQRFGVVNRYIEPFAGSLATLLRRPHRPTYEIVNDADGFVANFWRAMKIAPAEVTKHLDWPINEVDLRARSKWLVERRADLTERLSNDPDFCDAKMAAWWGWGVGIAIGGGMNFAATQNNPIPRAVPGGTSAKTFDPAILKRIHVRLRNVQVACGDWKRILTPAYLQAGTDVKEVGILLDPPYNGDYNADYVATGDKTGNEVFEEVWQWAVENGSNLGLRIALCGYDDGRPTPDGWTVHKWKAQGGYSNTASAETRNDNPDKERIWFSPGCLPTLDTVLGG